MNGTDYRVISHQTSCASKVLLRAVWNWTLSVVVTEFKPDFSEDSLENPVSPLYTAADLSILFDPCSADLYNGPPRCLAVLPSANSHHREN